MDKKIEHLPQEQIAQFLPEALRRAMTSYHKHASRSIAGKPEEFGTLHKDLKAAVAHIELLVKLAKLADLPDAAKNPGDRAMIEALIHEAASDLAGFEEKKGGCSRAVEEDFDYE